MYCKRCGEKSNNESKFCINCGEVFSRINTETTTDEHFPLHKFFIAIIIVSIISYGAFLILGEDVYEDDTNVEYSEDLGILFELEPNIQPVGYFTKSELFDSSSISDEEWFSYIEYSNSEFVDVSLYNNSKFPNQFDIYSSVVKIVCFDKDYYYYGSGTNIDPSGYVVTNLHVLEGKSEVECMVGFPDPQTGIIREAYWSTPIIDIENGTNLDLAMLSIEDPVFDEKYNIYGFYNRLIDRTFPYYEETDKCLNTAPELGNEVFVLGYPSLSGGALTITDGLISSLYSVDGYLITSAKIGSGNSGGLAIDNNACFVGIPTAVYSNEDDEYYGEIIDAAFVYEFYDAVFDDIEIYEKGLNIE